MCHLPYFLSGFNNDLLSPTQVSLKMLQEFSILLLYSTATSQYLLCITYLHLINDTVLKKGSNELHASNITIITVGSIAKYFRMKNMARTPNLLGLHTVDCIGVRCSSLVAKSD